jgi:hypothetical protein
MSIKIPMIPLGTETATFQPVAQCLNQLRCRPYQYETQHTKIIYSFQCLNICISLSLYAVVFSVPLYTSFPNPAKILSLIVLVKKFADCQNVATKQCGTHSSFSFFFTSLSLSVTQESSLFSRGQWLIEDLRVEVCHSCCSLPVPWLFFAYGPLK